MGAALTGSCHCGQTGWTFEGTPEQVTACNCTLCRRLGTLWAYGADGKTITLSGETKGYTRADSENPFLEIRFCPKCAAVQSWCALKDNNDGERLVAVNIRLADPETVEGLSVRKFDGLETFKALPKDNRCVSDIWF